MTTRLHLFGLVSVLSATAAAAAVVADAGGSFDGAADVAFTSAFFAACVDLSKN